VSTESDIAQSTEEALHELQAVFDLYQQSKGKKPQGVTEARSREWAALAAMILVDATCPLDSFLSNLSALPPSISATGAITAWPSMTKERRAAYLRWVDTLDSKRAASQKATLIPGLLGHSPETSVDLLCNTSLNKELKDRLASSLLIDSSDKVILLLTSDSLQDKVPDLLKRLLELTDGPKVTAEAKGRIIRLALNTMATRNLLDGSLGEALLRSIEVQMRSLPPAVKQEMKDLLTELDVHLAERFFPGEASTIEPPPPPVPERVPETTPIAPIESMVAPFVPAEFASTAAPSTPLSKVHLSTSTAPSTITQQLSGWLTTLQQQVTILQELQEHIRRLEEQQVHLDDELRKSRAEKEEASNAAAENLAARHAAEEKIRTLEVRLREADTSAQLAREQLDSLSRSMAVAVEKEKALREELAQQEAKFLNERSELFQRIEANAERRLEEYRNGLASSFARLFNGVPDRRSALAPETGAVLLARLYEVIDFLESKNIRVLSR